MTNNPDSIAIKLSLDLQFACRNKTMLALSRQLFLYIEADVLYFPLLNNMNVIEACAISNIKNMAAPMPIANELHLYLRDACYEKMEDSLGERVREIVDVDVEPFYVVVEGIFKTVYG